MSYYIKVLKGISRLKIILLGIIFAMFTTCSKAAIVVFGDNEDINKNCNSIYHDLFDVAEPDLQSLNEKHSHQGLKFEFVPEVVYQILTLKLKRANQSSQDVVKGIWRKISPPNFHEYSTFNSGSSENGTASDLKARFIEDMIGLNRFGKSFAELLEQAQRIISSYDEPTKRNNKEDPISFLSPTLFHEVVKIEFEAFRKGHTVLWRFTRGLPNEKLPLDSILTLTDQLRTISSDIDCSRGLKTNGLSYGRSLLDGLESECIFLSNPFKDYDKGNSPACTFGFLANHLLSLDLLNFIIKDPTTHEDLKSRARDRLNELSRHTLYYISVPTGELDRIGQYFFDSRAVTKSFHGNRAHGEYFHYALRFLSKGVSNRFMPYGGDRSYYKSMDQECSAQNLDNPKILVKTWHTWMNDYMKVLYTNNREIGPFESTGQEQAYKKFFQQDLVTYTNEEATIGYSKPEVDVSIPDLAMFFPSKEKIQKDLQEVAFYEDLIKRLEQERKTQTSATDE